MKYWLMGYPDIDKMENKINQMARLGWSLHSYNVVRTWYGERNYFAAMQTTDDNAPTEISGAEK